MIRPADRASNRSTVAEAARAERSNRPASARARNLKGERETQANELLLAPAWRRCGRPGVSLTPPHRAHEIEHAPELLSITVSAPVTPHAEL